MNTLLDRAHKMFSDDAPPGGIVCLCIRGQDHTEEEFDIPLGEEIPKYES